MEIRRNNIGSIGLRRRILGVSVLEMLIAMLIISFLVVGTVGLYNVGFRQQRTARRYSQAQTDGRAGLARMTRGLRHGYHVVATSSAGNLNGLTSTANRVIVSIPQPTGSTPIDVMYAVDNAGNLFYQGQGDASGTTIISGVASMTINYFVTADAVSGTTTNATDNAPGAATEIQVTLDVLRDNLTTRLTSYITLRNSARMLQL